MNRFIETARKLGCDEDKAKFESALRKIAAHKPKKDKSHAVVANKDNKAVSSNNGGSD